MDIQDIRRQNLATWLESHTAPPKEKSLFSQIKSGTSPFGERLARRLERDYGMGTGFLDHAEQIESPNRGQKPPLSASAKMLIEWVERMDALGDPARKIFPQMASILEVVKSIKDAHNSVVGPLDEDKLSQADKDLSEMARTERPGAKSHATRKRAGR